MPNLDRSHTVQVYLVESNPLAALYVLELLAKDSLMQAVNLHDGDKIELAGHPITVFLFDNSELPLPLSEYVRRLRTHYPAVKFLVMGREESRENVIRMLFLGINGFVPYQDVPQFLIAAIHAVASGKMWLSREILTEYVQRTATISCNGGNGFDALTNRESQILELVKRRLSNKEIGEILSIRESTVKFHLSNIFSKLQISNRHALIDQERTCIGGARIFRESVLSIS